MKQTLEPQPQLVSPLKWNILRTLTDPYPNEQETREIAKGTGNVMVVAP